MVAGRGGDAGAVDRSSRQARKHTIGLAGEFLVAGELLRRGIMAAVTYGNAKNADVLAARGDRATNLEVKTTSEGKWVLGGRLPESSRSLWVLVYLPAAEAEAPEYFVLTGAELRQIVLPQHDAYNERYRQKHGKDYSAAGVVSVRRELVGSQHKGAWGKVDALLEGRASFHA
ncbi:MAG: hypothetical protein K1Y01_06650 [Vicinamibacteria bacterium]|nr:hypothetical protein [Vicinamibacteria bacterium]